MRTVTGIRVSTVKTVGELVHMTPPRDVYPRVDKPPDQRSGPRCNGRSRPLPGEEYPGAARRRLTGYVIEILHDARDSFEGTVIPVLAGGNAPGEIVSPDPDRPGPSFFIVPCGTVPYLPEP
jgi:hypothetical protein